MCGGSGIVIEHGEWCGDDGTDEPCPICRGEELDPDFVAMIEQAAVQPGKAMTFDEAIELLRTL
jgi:hypothetical protein